MTTRLSFRSRPAGGPVSPEPPPDQSAALLPRRHLVLLIHGYNNDEADSRLAYEGFARLQRKLADLPPETPVAGGRLVEVYWPGDADWGVVAPAFYMWSIARARETALALARTLRAAVTASGYKRIDIVSHSMGGRLVLEVLKALGDESAPSELYVGRIVFMAAAVPTFTLEPRGALRGGYDRHLSESALSLHSSDDTVLRYAFPLGQTLSGKGEGFFPTALGFEAWADPERPANLAQAPVTGAGHADYWGWKESSLAEAEIASRHVHDFLGFEEAGRRAVLPRVRRARATVETRRPGVGRVVPPRAVLGAAD